MPVVETTWWSRLSTLRHLIVSPATMLTVAGENELRRIWTPLVAASASGASTKHGEQAGEPAECAS